MSELRMEEWVMPAARLGPPSPLVPFVVDTANLVTRSMVDPSVPPEEVEHIGYGYVDGCLPYLVQDDYDRRRRPRAFRAAVLENEILRASFLPELGGRLWSLVHKPEGRELLFANPVFQPANMAIRDAWFSGGVEWNFCWIGHTPLTCSPLFAARAELDDGTPVLRLWEYERVRRMPYQIDAFLPDGSPVLFVRVRLVNPHDRTVPVYWWSNIAVPESPDARVLAPAESTLSFDYAGKLSVAPFPRRDGRDLSYPTNAPHARDYFFRIPGDRRPWVASVDRSGRGFFHASTPRLSGRKVWVFGMGRGGRAWQDFLNTPGHAYIEIQAGLTRMQSQCLPMPAGAEWEWLEAYGAVHADGKIVHGADWSAACGAVEDHIQAMVPAEDLDRRLSATCAAAGRAPVQVLHKGSGWGALERLRRRQAGEPSFHAPGLVFDEDTLTPEQAPWLALLRTGALPETDPQDPPASYVVQGAWRQMLDESIRAGRSDHWLAWLHLGIMHLAEKRFDEARATWERSISLRPSAWAYRHLAALAALREDGASAAALYLRAAEMAPTYARLVAECGRALISAGQPRRWLELLDGLDGEVRGAGRIRLLEAEAALAAGDLDRAGGILNQRFEITDIREGEGGPARLWYAYQARRLAAAEGRCVDEETLRRARREFPPPPYLDFRLH